MAEMPASLHLELASSGNLRVSLRIEWPLAEQHFVGGDSETPPINMPGIAGLPNDFGCHIGHATSHTSMQSAFRVVDGNVEISNVDVPFLIKEDVVWFDITAEELGDEII
jgi:hypothetical protein